MSTNIIYITNTFTNVINMPAEVTNTVLRVAEMPSKAWWEIALMIGGPALTALSALFMWRSVEELKRQTDINIVLDIYTKLQEHGNSKRQSDMEHQKYVIQLGNLCMKAANIYYYVITCKRSKFFFDNSIKIYFEKYIDGHQKYNIDSYYAVHPKILRYCQEHGIEIPKELKQDTQ